MLRRVIASAVILGLISQPVFAASCYTAVEAGAVGVRQLQTELMVAALKCHNHGYAPMYNAFVGKFRPNLSRNADVLRAHFSRAYGRDHARRFDTYITSLANEASIRSIRTSDYCASMGPVFDSLLADIRSHELEAYALRTMKTDTPTCEVKLPPQKPVKSARITAKAE